MTYKNYVLCKYFVRESTLVISVEKSINLFKFKKGVLFSERVILGDNPLIPGEATFIFYDIVFPITLKLCFTFIEEGFGSFIGCLTAVSVNKYNLQKQDYQNQSSKKLEIGSCNLENICPKQSCVHGNCISLFHGFECDCGGTFYNGKYCQFSKYTPVTPYKMLEYCYSFSARLKSSCQEYANLGLKETGSYLVDLSINKSHSQLTNFCDMNNSTQSVIKTTLISEYLIKKDQSIIIDYG